MPVQKKENNLRSSLVVTAFSDQALEVSRLFIFYGFPVFIEEFYISTVLP